MQSLKINGRATNVEMMNGHIRLPSLKKGEKILSELNFTAGELGLHRRDDFVYTLFVPDNASKTFPCFDQPDLKAKYQLTLNIPNDWKAVSQSHVVANLRRRQLSPRDLRPGQANEHVSHGLRGRQSFQNRFIEPYPDAR